MPGSIVGKLLRVLDRLAKAAGVLILLGLGHIAYVLLSIQHECAVLPNGATIEHASLIPSYFVKDWPPVMILRDAEGRVLERSNKDIRIQYDVNAPEQFVLRFGNNLNQSIIIENRGFIESIHGGFMRNFPRDFEKKPLDMRTDLYGIHYEMKEHRIYRRAWCKWNWFGD